MPPYTTSSLGFSATSGSRLFCIMRNAASVSQLLQVSSLPRGARIARVGVDAGGGVHGVSPVRRVRLSVEFRHAANVVVRAGVAGRPRPRYRTKVAVFSANVGRHASRRLGDTTMKFKLACIAVVIGSLACAPAMARDKMPIPDLEKQDTATFQAQVDQVHQQMGKGGRFEFIKDDDRAAVEDGLKFMHDLIEHPRARTPPDYPGSPRRRAGGCRRS